jgi:thermitase
MMRPRTALVLFALLAAAPASMADEARGLLDGLAVPPNPPARYVNRPGKQELTGRMIARPVQRDRWLGQGITGEQADAKRAEAAARLAGSVVKMYPEVDEYLIGIPEGLTEDQVSAALLATGLYEYVEPDWLCYPVVIPNDPNYNKQWHLPKMQAPAAWDITTGSNVILAITDSGLTHPDFDVVPGWNIPSNNNNTADINGHGTFCAGMAGAKGNNGVGVVGAGWNFRIMPVRVTNNANGSAYLTDILNGGRWAADNGARGISASFSGVTNQSVQTTGKYIKGKNALYLYAAGNDGKKLNGADWADVIIVGATTSADVRASFSNYGALIDVTAPGYNVYSTKKTNTYGTSSGTSFSTPLVNGVIGMIWSANPGLSAQQVEEVLFASCKDLGNTGEDDVYGHGRSDLLMAVVNAGNFAGMELPFFEPFGNLNLDPSIWTEINGAIVTDLASNEPSGPYSLGLAATSSAASNKFDLQFGDPALTISFWSQHKFVEQGKSLKAEYYSTLLGSWQTYATIVSNGNDQSNFVRTSFSLPPEGFGPDFRLRFTAVGGDGGDLWFVDDVTISGTECSADLTGDGTLDLFDFLAFANLFNAQDPAADWDNDGEFTFFDFLAYNNSFVGGC